jgi:hypothetical protein
VQSVNKAVTHKLFGSTGGRLRSSSMYVCGHSVGIEGEAVEPLLTFALGMLNEVIGTGASSPASSLLTFADLGCCWSRRQSACHRVRVSRPPRHCADPSVRRKDPEAVF